MQETYSDHSNSPNSQVTTSITLEELKLNLHTLASQTKSDDMDKTAYTAAKANLAVDQKSGSMATIPRTQLKSYAYRITKKKGCQPQETQQSLLQP